MKMIRNRNISKTKVALGLICAAVAFMILSYSSSAFADDIVIIANKDVPIDSISSRDLKRIFLARKTEWANESVIAFVTLQGSTVHKVFLETYIFKSSSQFQRHFRALVFSGKGMMPQTLSTESAAVSYVSRTSGAIGYIFAGTDTGTAKVLKVIHEGE